MQRTFPVSTDAIPIAAIAAAATGLAILPLAWSAAATVAILSLPLLWYAFSVRWLPLFLAAVILLPPLPLPVGDTGPNPSVILAAVGLLAGLARLREWTFSFSLLPAALLGYLGAIVVSLGFALLNSSAGIVASSAARVGLFGIGLYVFWTVAFGPAGRGDRHRIGTGIFWVAAVAALFGCVDFIFQLPAPAGFEPQFLWLDSGVYRRAQGLFYEASTLGNFCSFFVVMSVVLLAEDRERRWIPAFQVSLAVLIFATAMLLSFSRASVLACGISLFTLAVIERQRWRKYGALVGLAAVILLAALTVTVVLPEVAGGYWARFDAIGSTLETPDRVLSGRLESWRTLGSFIVDHPWQTVLGIGYKTLPYTEYLGRPVVADNAYLSMLVECGVLGLLALLALNCSILTVGWRAMRRGSIYGKWIFCFWVGEMFQMLSGDILTYWRVLPVYFWVLGQAFLDSRESDPGESSPDRSIL